MMVIYSTLMSVLLFGVLLYGVLWVVERDIKPSFSHAIYLSAGIKLGMFAVVLVLGGLLGSLVLAPALFAAWAILHRYGRLSEMQAMGAIGILLLVELGFKAAGLS